MATLDDGKDDGKPTQSAVFRVSKSPRPKHLHRRKPSPAHLAALIERKEVPEPAAIDRDELSVVLNDLGAVLNRLQAVLKVT